MKKILTVLLFVTAISINIFAQNFSRELKIQKPRLNGKDVELVQQKLHELGYLPEEEVDGWFGPKTESAVKDFQKKNDLPVTGAVNESTYGMLKSGKASYVDKVNRSIEKQNFKDRFKKNANKTVEGDAPFPVGYVFTNYIAKMKKNDEVCRRIDLRIVGDGSGWEYEFYSDWNGKLCKVKRYYWHAFGNEKSNDEIFYIENGNILLKTESENKEVILVFSKEENDENINQFQEYLDMQE